MESISNNNLTLVSNNNRREPRVKLPITLYLRRPINTPNYRRKVKTENVSSQGACLISDIKLPTPYRLISKFGVYRPAELFPQHSNWPATPPH